MHVRSRALRPMIAPVLYLMISLHFFGTTRGYATSVFGYGGDSFTFVWCLQWWPWAIAHGVNPLVTQAVWYPRGIDMTWVTSIPTLSLIGLPLTLTAGAIVTFNSFCLLAPALSAWAAFLLARQVTRDVAAAFVAGYLYGFSAYEFGHLLGHLNLSMTCLVPLLLLICLKRLAGEIPRKRGVALLTVALLMQFGISLEIFATACVFGVAGWVVALLLASRAQRAELRGLALDCLAALAIVTVLVSPFLFFLLRGMRNLPASLNLPIDSSADPLNFLVPTAVTRLGASYVTSIASRFTSGLGEQTAYLGAPVILILTALFARRLAEPVLRGLLAMLLLLVLCSLGPRLWLDGTQTGIWLPWALADHVPLLRSALPGRFTMYVFLAAGLAVGIWLAEPGRAVVRGRRFLLALLACLFLLPDRSVVGNWKPAGLQPFFDEARAATVLRPGQHVLLLPFSLPGVNMIWQWQARYAFTQSAGFTGLVPPAEAADPAVATLTAGTIVPELGQMITTYCRRRDVTAIIAGPGTAPALLAVLRTIGWPSTSRGGVVVFSEPAAAAR